MPRAQRQLPKRFQPKRHVDKIGDDGVSRMTAFVILVRCGQRSRAANHPHSLRGLRDRVHAVSRVSSGLTAGNRPAHAELIPLTPSPPEG